MQTSIDLTNAVGLKVEEYNEAPVSSNTSVVITANYVKSLFLCIALWGLFVSFFIWIIDPYGVSPLHVNLPGVNIYKPKRLDIDRLIKPYEVLRYQPKTIFIGTSRIHQSIDPSVFDGTDYAPAYNAAIPASTLAENEANIEQFLKFDPQIKHIFMELFLYNFVTGQSPTVFKTTREFFNNYFSLQLSGNAFFDALQTIYSNQNTGPITSYIAKQGFRVLDSTFEPVSTFSDALYTHNVISYDRAAKMSLQPSAFAVLDRIVKLTQDHGVQLHLLITPNYPWDDYRLNSLGYWPLLEEWIQKMGTYGDVVSFSQYNNFLEEPPVPSPRMVWWNDPIHFSLNMGRAMMLTYLGRPDKGTPTNLMRQLNLNTVKSVIAERHEGLMHWVATHPDFVDDFEEAKTNSDSVIGRLDIPAMKLIVNRQEYSIVPGVGEVSFIASQQKNSLTPNGWAVDEIGKRHVSKLVATAGSAVVAQGFATVRRADIDLAIGKHDVPSGFSMEIPISEDVSAQPIRVFALMRDGRAVLLESKTPLIDSTPLAKSLGTIQGEKLIIGDRTYPIVKRTAGSIESVTEIEQGYSVAGWAADIKANAPVQAIVVAIGPNVIVKGLPIGTRADILAGVSSGANPSGFVMTVPLYINKRDASLKVQLFALMADGIAVPLAANFAETTNGIFKKVPFYT